MHGSFDIIMVVQKILLQDVILKRILHTVMTHYLKAEGESQMSAANVDFVFTSLKF